MIAGRAGAPGRAPGDPGVTELLDLLACPRHRGPLHPGDGLECAAGCRFPIRDGVPVLLLDEAAPTHPEFARSLAAATPEPPASAAAPDAIDPFVQSQVGATNGPMYAGLIGRLTRYPIPAMRLPAGPGLLLDVGCNWGRWCVAAARLGWQPVGVDPSLKAVLAARRVAAQLGVSARYVVGDARHLPFREGLFDVAWSYSVLQHLAKSDVRQSLREMRRVLAPGGRCVVQLPNSWAAHALYKRLRRPGRPAGFDVRYWSPPELARTFTRLVGPASIEVDGFFTLDSQAADLDLLAWRHAMVVRASEALRRMSLRVPALSRVAESLTITASRGAGRSASR